MANAGRSQEQKDLFCQSIAEVVAQELFTSPNQIWIYYQEINPQNIWFGGTWNQLKT